jgi:type 1 fimbria pilin
VSQKRTATAIIFGALLASAGSINIPANAQERLEAQYRITMTGVPVGNITWQVKIENNMYATSASGGASGVLSLLINGQALVATNGKIVDGHLAPTNFSSNIIDDDGKTELHVSFRDSIAKELVVQEASEKTIVDAHR